MQSNDYDTTRTNCSWPFFKHEKWERLDKFGRMKFTPDPDESAVDSDDVIGIALMVCFGLTLFLLHLAGRYGIRRRYYEPLALEVKAYSADIGSTTRKTALDETVLAGSDVPDYAASIVLALLDPLSTSYSFDLAMHDYSRTFVSTILTVLVTRGVYYIMAYHVFTYCSKENFSCVSDFLHRRYNSMGLANISTVLILAMDTCQLILLYNRVAREMLGAIGGSYQLWLCFLSLITFALAVCGTASLIRIGLLIYCSSIVVYFWISLHLRFQFSKGDLQNIYTAWKFKAYETQKEDSMEVSDILLYDSNIVCIFLTAPLLHTTFRMGQTEYVIYQSLARRFKRKRVFVRAFLLTFAYNMCHSVVIRSVFAVQTFQGCDEILAGIRCHYEILSWSIRTHSALKTLYVTVMFYHSCWLAGLTVIAMAYTATRSRLMRSFVEYCLIGQRWTAMNRWRRQNGLIMFRDCKMIDLQVYVYKIFAIFITSSTFLFCLDYITTDPPALTVQFANYLLLDMRFIFCFNATVNGLLFRRLSKAGLAMVLVTSVIIYVYQVLWGDRLTKELLQFKLMTPLFKSHAAWLRRKCPKIIRLRPVINVGKRIVDHEVVHLMDSDAFYLALIGISWGFAAVSNCMSSASLAVLKTPYYPIGDALSLKIASKLRGQLFNRVQHMVNSARASLRSVEWRLRGKAAARGGGAATEDAERGRGDRRQAESDDEPDRDKDQSVVISAAVTTGPVDTASAESEQSQEQVDAITLRSQLIRRRFADEENNLVLGRLAEAAISQRTVDLARRRRQVIRTSIE